MKKNISRSLSFQNLLAVGILASYSPLAFSEPTTGATADAKSQTIEEVIVTSQRRAEKLQKVPIAVTAFTAETLKNLQINNASDLAKYTPDLTYSAGAEATGTGVNFFIRGIGQNDFKTTEDPGVAVYFDDVYFGRVTGANVDLGDIAKVEVLRGPQGTLFGRNTIAGAVSITTNKPNFEFGGNADLTVGSIDQLVVHATVNVPVVDGKVATRFSVLGDYGDGYGTDFGPNGVKHDLGQNRIAAGRGQLLWNVSDDFDVLVVGDIMRQRGTSLPGGLVDIMPSATLTAFNKTIPVKIGPQWLVQGYTSYLYVNPDDDVDSQGAAVTMTWRPGDVTVKSITSYRDQKVASGEDFGGVPVPFLAQQAHETQWQVSQEVQLTGSVFDDRLKYTGGVYYFSEGSDFDTYAAYLGGPLDVPFAAKDNDVSVYGQATYNITDKLSITGGVRWTDEYKSIDVQTSLYNVIILPRSFNSVRYYSTTPMGNISYQWTDNLMTYASISEGFRSGGFTGLPFSEDALTPFRPEKTTTYEVGSKVDFLEHRARLNLAAFYNDYTDIQVNAATLNSAGQLINVYTNAAEAKIYGLEAELKAKLLPGLEAYANGSYLQSTLSPAPGFSFNTSVLPSAPKFIVNAGLQYGFGVKDYGTATASADMSYQSSSYPQFNESEPSKQEGYVLVNARVVFQPTNSPWKFTLWGKNLGDSKYKLFGQTSGSGDLTVGWFGRPREGGATVAVQF